MDPRISVIDKRLDKVKRIIAVSGGKGGIGKSVTASTLALHLARRGLSVGLLDLDVCGPSDQVILGITGVYPEEDKGLVPPVAYGIHFMTITFFAGNNPVPLRGQEVSNAIIEMLAITRWPELDYLIIDMPPGTGDPALDVIRLIKRVEFLVVTTPSRVALAMAEKELTVFRELKVKVAGVLENMRQNEDGLAAASELSGFAAPFFKPVNFDRNLEAALGNGEKLLQTAFAAQLADVAKELG